MSAVPGTYKNRTPGGITITKASQNGRKREGYGTIMVVTSERGTYTSFWNDLSDTDVTMLAQDPRHHRIIRMGVDICGALNTAVRNLRGDWLWIMGDDHAFRPDLLPRLIAHDVPVVVPNVLRRNPPWAPVVNSHQNDDGWHVMAVLPEDDLVEVWSAGDAGMLIRREVFDAIEDPWFTPTPGSIGLDYDMNFCRKVRDAGFKIYCDSGAMLGHISNHTVWPEYRDGHWQVSMEFDQHRIPMRRIFSDEEEQR